MGFGSFLKSVGHVVGKVAKYGSIPLALTGVGAPLAAGIGALGGALENVTGGDASLKGALTSSATGGALGLAGGGLDKVLGGGNVLKTGLSSLGGLFGGSGGAAGDAAGASATDGATAASGQSTLSKILGGLGGAGKDVLGALSGGGGGLGGLGALGGLLLGGLNVKDQTDQQNKAAAFEQGKFDILKAALGKGETAYDEKAPLRQGGTDAMTQALARLQGMSGGVAADSLNDLKSGKRAAGQYI